MVELNKAKSEIRACPDCGKAFYVLTNESVTCPYCGFTLKERRGKNRKRTVLSFCLKVGSADLSADLLDYSDFGARLACSKGFEANSTVLLKIDHINLNRPARAVWTKWLSPYLAVTGLEFIKERGWSA